MVRLAQTLLSLLSLSALAAAGPIRYPRADNSTKIRTSEMHYIYPNAPSLSKPTTSALYVEAYSNKSQVEQVAVFRGIPAEAKSCTVGWSQADKNDRVFIVKGDSGHTTMRPLIGFPSGEVSYESVAPFDRDNEDQQFGPDFTFWDDASYAATEHVGGGVKCSSEVYIKVLLRDPTVQASVFLEQDSKNGLWLSYTT
ncbi:unnamed protein product [Clonostachys byssicola]|uniref:Ubiquitin 3 binding protein But2 C-terminal domain-containing protein n=1 Tax=Clonostachys byssicola TaxID=160290 RepID=A0A9N9U9S1_9HYPO|nr:unnamed protein product [Clonostachys byssicola]